MNQTTFQSALDNVRNMVGSSLAGIDHEEMVDTRELCDAINDLLSLDPVTNTQSNPYWGNLPCKFNIAISGSRDDYAHTHTLMPLAYNPVHMLKLKKWALMSCWVDTCPLSASHIPSRLTCGFLPIAIPS